MATVAGSARTSRSGTYIWPASAPPASEAVPTSSSRRLVPPFRCSVDGLVAPHYDVKDGKKLPQRELLPDVHLLRRCAPLAGRDGGGGRQIPRWADRRAGRRRRRTTRWTPPTVGAPGAVHDVTARGSPPFIAVGRNASPLLAGLPWARRHSTTAGRPVVRACKFVFIFRA